ncbi:hypothetical protein GDO86_007370 [Hymenochirus boettgeri]|uniref:Nucleolar protein 8 n=1 Tax=Hymenochirus boettgeri TaxID=247094 RepID=A0A8T2ITG8_9PIPI|nr:hypothetical protein GDO86_007370 [Hymenochirus boettgeri]
MGTTIGTGDAKEETGVKINLVHKSKLVDQQNDQCKKLPKTQRKTESEMIKSNITTSSSSDSDDDTSSSEDRSSILPMSVRPSKCLQGPDAKIIEEKSISNKQVTVNEPVSGVLKQQDNAKRLAAMEERRKERELQKQTIQGALLKLDSQPSSKGKHVVFDSDAESDQDYTESKSSEVKSEFKEKEQNKTTKLFGSSEEESDEDDGSTDGKQFQIKSQYEGRSGEKLMHLQSRFGTDERFKMDSRFLDDSSEDEDDEERKKVAQVEKDDLSAEKKKNLDILRSLNINVEQPALSKQASKAKKFKDVNALQYDPSREDHAVFERKAEDDKKESKSQRKKKRIEAEKLPEVSSETYHEVTVDFKEVFGASKPYESTRATWDQEHEIEGVEQEDSTNSENFSFLGQKKDENTGFTFSFFQTAVEETVCNEETYNIKPIKPAKLAWLEDPRFQDSSSDGEENDEPYISKETSRSSETKPSENAMRFLFFVKGDHRLKEGPKMFFRSSNLEKEEEAWQERRDFLLEECRKRHKDAKRKVKAKQ